MNGFAQVLRACLAGGVDEFAIPFLIANINQKAQTDYSLLKCHEDYGVCFQQYLSGSSRFLRDGRAKFMLEQ